MWKEDEEQSYGNTKHKSRRVLALLDCAGDLKLRKQSQNRQMRLTVSERRTARMCDEDIFSACIEFSNMCVFSDHNLDVTGPWLSSQLSKIRFLLLSNLVFVVS